MDNVYVLNDNYYYRNYYFENQRKHYYHTINQKYNQRNTVVPKIPHHLSHHQYFVAPRLPTSLSSSSLSSLSSSQSQSSTSSSLASKKSVTKSQQHPHTTLNMMFKKYMSKISNTIGTVNYLQHKAKENRQHSKRHLYDDGYDVQDIDPAAMQQYEYNRSHSHSDSNNNNSKMDVDAAMRGPSRRASSVLGGLSANNSQQIVLSNAMANLRNTLLHYPLVSAINYYYIWYEYSMSVFCEYQIFTKKKNINRGSSE